MGILAPVRNDFYEQSQIDLFIDQLFELLTRLRADILEHLALAADENFLLGVPLHVHGRFDAQQFGKVFILVNLHGKRIGQFVIHRLDRFFSNDLGREKTLWLVCYLVLRKVRLALGEQRENLGQQLFASAALQSGNWHDGRELERFVIRLDERQELFFRKPVHLVQSQYGFPGESLGAIEKKVISMRGSAAGIDHQQKHVDAFQSSGHFMHHLPPQGRVRRVQPWSIDKNNLALGPRYKALNAVARRLRLGSDNRDLLANQAVEERRLPRVGTSHNRHESRLVPSLRLALLLVPCPLQSSCVMFLLRHLVTLPPATRACSNVPRHGPE